MYISTEILHELIPYATDRNILKYVNPINKTLELYEINTIKRIAAFIAQITHESGSLRYIEELADGSAYEFRKDLGNLEPLALEAAHKQGYTTGKFYKGRGILQITGFYNYRNIGKYLNIDLINNPFLLKLPTYACLSAGYFWKSHNCNELADYNKFVSITKVINGGVNGLKERREFYKNNLKILKSYEKSSLKKS